jgi:hypothetical protein
MICRFLYYARVFVRHDWKSFPGTKHSSLVQKLVNYGQKSFITLVSTQITSKKSFIGSSLGLRRHRQNKKQEVFFPLASIDKIS